MVRACHTSPLASFLTSSRYDQFRVLRGCSDTFRCTSMVSASSSARYRCWTCPKFVAYRREPAAARLRSLRQQLTRPMATNSPRICKRFVKASLCLRQLWRSCAPTMAGTAAPKSSRTSRFSSQNAGGMFGCAAGKPGDCGSALYVVRSLVQDVMHAMKHAWNMCTPGLLGALTLSDTES